MWPTSSKFSLYFALFFLFHKAGVCDDSPTSIYPSPFIKPAFQQFEHFYFTRSNSLFKASIGPCNQTLLDYRAAYNAPSGSTRSKELLSLCYAHEQCILDNISSNLQANLQSASVVLGLVPTLLSTTGPSLAELSLISMRRPLLTALLSLGSPGVWPTRIFEYSDPFQVLTGQGSIGNRGTLWQWRLNSRRGWIGLLSGLQYLVAIAAVSNVILTSIDMGQRSILAWGCTSWFAPLAWSLAPFVLYLLSTSSFRFAWKKSSHLERQHGESRQRMSARALSYLRKSMAKEVILCAQLSEQERLSHEPVTKLPKWTVVVNVLAGLGGFLHMITGIVIFSSLQFITVNHAVSSIMWRYLLSTVGCRFVLVIEIAGLRRNEARNGSANIATDK